MIRSVCILLPRAEHHTPWQSPLSSLAASLAATGLAVHLLAPAPGDETRQHCVNGVVVHELPLPTPTGASDIDDLLWAQNLAAACTTLEQLVHLDVVLATDLGAPALRVATGPGTSLVVYVESGRCLSDPPDPRARPEASVAGAAERAALRRADLLLSPTERIGTLVRARLGLPALAVPPLIGAEVTRRGERRLRSSRLLAVGRIDETERATAALGLAGQLSQGAERVGLTVALLGAGPNDSRLGALVASLAASAASLEVEVARIDGLTAHAVEDLVATSRGVVPLAPHAGLDPFAVAALRHDVPVVCGPCDGVAELRDGDHRIVVLDPNLSRVAADLHDAWQTCSARMGAGGDRSRLPVPARLDPEGAAEAIAELLGEHAQRPSVAPRFRAPRRDRPRLGVVITATAGEAFTVRAIDSLLEHAETPLSIAVVGPASHPTTAALCAGDPRITWIQCGESEPISERRNRGLAVLGADRELLVFLHGDVEVIANWWLPVTDALRGDDRLVGTLGLVRAGKAPGPFSLRPVASAAEQPLVVGGPVVALTPATLGRLGRFDSRLAGELVADLEFGLRARRVGVEAVVAEVPGILHLAHPACELSAGPGPALSGYQVVADLLRGADTVGDGELLVLADARNAVEQIGLLRTWAQSFTRQDPASLVLYGPAVDAEAYVARLREVARNCGLDLEEGPRIVAKLPPMADAALEATLGAQVHALIGTPPPGSAFAHLPCLADDDPAALRRLATGVWRATPGRQRQAV